MPRTCTVCEHPARPKIDAALVGGGAIRGIARKYRVSEDALPRHRAHVPPVLAKAHEAGEVARGDNLLAKVQGLEADARRIAAAAEQAGDLRTALQGVRELARIVELLAKLRGELDSGTTLNVAIVGAPEWQSVRGRVLAALAPFPDARRAVSEALAGD